MPRFALTHFTFFIFASIAALYSAHAETNTARVVALVRDEAITSLDVEDRLQIALSASGLPKSPDILSRLRGQILQVLIDEKLYMQEGDRLGYTIAQDELARAIAGVEAHNHVAPGSFDQFLAKEGVSKEAVIYQIKAQLMWNKIIARRIRPKIVVSTQEIQEAMEKISSSSGLMEVSLGEIVLPVENTDREEATAKLAEKLAGEIRAGADFANIARQFSRSPSASSGGNLGWVEISQLAPLVAEPVKKLSPGEVSDPIRQNDGYYLYKVFDRHALAAVKQGETEVAIKQMFLPFPATGSTKLRNELVTKANELRDTISSCESFDAVATRSGSTIPADLVRIQLKSLNEDIQPVVAATSVGQVSPVVQSRSGIHLIMVCERIDATPPLARKEQVVATLTSDKTALQAKRYLRNLRRDAFIDVRE